MSQSPSRGVPSVPVAPYPPAAPPGRSALSSSPQYRTILGSSGTSAQQVRRDPMRISSSTQQQQRIATDDRTSAKFRPCHVLFSPSQRDVYACINCTSLLEGDAPAQVSSRNNKRNGPVLLELRRLSLDKERETSQLFRSTLLTTSQGNPSLGASVASTCMAYPAAESTIPITPCATGLTTGALCIHTFFQADDEVNSTVTYFAPRHQRPASAVAWRPGINTHQVAIGLVGTGSGGMHHHTSSGGGGGGPRRGGGGGGGGSRGGGGVAGDREFCCLLWDVQKGTATGPVSKLSHNVGVASLAWLDEGRTLCVGSQMRHFHLYDLRVSVSTTSPTSTWAHSEAVSGIEPDPNRPDIFATFGAGLGEPVKLWDRRRLDSSVGEVKTTGSTTVSAIKWSKLQSGTLSVSLDDTVQHYETAASLSRPVLARLQHVGSPVLDLALYPFSHKQDGHEDNDVSSLHQNRMLVVDGDRTVRDMAQHNMAPVAISRRDGRIAHAFGGALWIGSSTEGPSAMECPTIQKDEDISAQMMRRAKCSRKARYSMDASLNIQMFAEESVDETIGDVKNGMLPSTLILRRLWIWIERIEMLCMPAGGMGRVWPGKGLADSGVWRLLQMDGTTKEGVGSDDVVTFDESLCCNTYDSPARRVALSACGWAGFEHLDDIIEECAAAGKFERAAALAVWHGDIGAAVEALHQGADAISSKANEDESSRNPVDLQYAETLQLVSMCIAGYRGADPNTSGSPVWQRACLSLLQRDELREYGANSVRVAYLRAACTFLVTMGTEDGLKTILHDENLSICDRVAFAVRFLDPIELFKYLDGCVAYCRSSGNLEGLVVTGLDSQGLKIVQAYVDKYTDVQTAALVCSRATFSGDWERSVCLQWMDAYRGLLNTWQMWQSRAMFDVDVAEYLSKLKARQGEEFQSQGGRLINYQGRRMLHPSIPAQVDARCNKCSKSLTGLRGRQDGVAPQRLAKAKPVLSCCPNCLNALPRCSICLLSLGCLNPFTEVKKDRANLPITEWFTWCMRCKHGGHAHHLVSWFAKHEVCPVSGCNCRCEFDAMKKIKRRTNSVHEDETAKTSDESNSDT